MLSDQSFGQGATVVFGHAVFPLEEVGDALRFDADFDAAQTCEEKIHFVLEAGRRAQVFGRWLRALDLAAADFQQSPADGKFADLDEAPGYQVIALAADAGMRILAEGLVAVGEEIGAR